LSDDWRAKLHDIIFESDTPAGKWFDIALLVAILASVTIISLETVSEFRSSQFLFTAEIILTGLFTVEYVLRLMTVRSPLKYAVSFWGIIDLLSILPSFVTPFIGSSSRSFVILRSIRLLRIFRVMKLWRLMDEADELGAAVWRARNKVVVFLAVVAVAVTISGTLMYHIETITWDGVDSKSQFTSIPQAMYWATVTMTTVGYGDVVPRTTLGKVIAVALILLGYSLIIVPSTFVSAEIMQNKPNKAEVPCPHCDAKGQRSDAKFCYRCGGELLREPSSTGET